VVIIESICHQLISLDYSFSCRSDCIFKPVARVGVANFQLSREWCCLHHLIEKEQSFSITEVSFAAAWQVPAAGMLTARLGPYLMRCEATASIACMEEDCIFAVLREASSSAFTHPHPS
jgi:hypothetical protein